MICTSFMNIVITNLLDSCVSLCKIRYILCVCIHFISHDSYGYSSTINYSHLRQHFWLSRQSFTKDFHAAPKIWLKLATSQKVWKTAESTNQHPNIASPHRKIRDPCFFHHSCVFNWPNSAKMPFQEPEKIPLLTIHYEAASTGADTLQMCLIRCTIFMVFPLVVNWRSVHHQGPQNIRAWIQHLALWYELYAPCLYSDSSL